MVGRPALLLLRAAAGLLALTGAAAAEVAGAVSPGGDEPAIAEPLAALSAAPGSYVMLLDAEGAIRVLQYRIGDGALLDFRQQPILLSADINQILVTDRGFMPTRIVKNYYLSGFRVDYLDEPPPPGTTGKADIEVAIYQSGYVQPARLRERIAVSFEWTGSEARAFSAGTLTGYLYETDLRIPLGDADGPHMVAEPVRRVYLPSVDLDLDADTWAMASDIRVGQVASSIELGPITWLVSDIPPEMRACIADVVALPGYLAYSAEIGALERRTLDLIDRAWTDLLEYGLTDYNAVNAKYGIVEKFRACIGV